jgi:hypothetical protein
MTKSILNLEGVQVLSRSQQKNVNGGLADKCQILQVLVGVPYENDGAGSGTYNGGAVSPSTCKIRCRPSFLGIGLGSWEYSTGPCDLV